MTVIKVEKWAELGFLGVDSALGPGGVHRAGLHVAAVALGTCSLCSCSRPGPAERPARLDPGPQAHLRLRAGRAGPPIVSALALLLRKTFLYLMRVLQYLRRNEQKFSFPKDASCFQCLVFSLEV